MKKLIKKNQENL